MTDRDTMQAFERHMSTRITTGDVQDSERRAVRVLLTFGAVLGLLLLAATKALAGEVVIKLPSEETLKVIYKAAKRFDVDAQDLIKIAYAESSFNGDARRVNSNGTVDFGMFQINSVHWTTTCKRFDVFKLKGNAECAAKLLKLASKHADDDADWIGRYHSGTPHRKVAYAAKLASFTLEGKE